ncbi:MAG: hypothetical protein GY830_03935 [Bacteroidetes bacterium]|nr:hypothetical protein [Bacteroidota bacterium]
MNEKGIKIKEVLQVILEKGVHVKNSPFSIATLVELNIDEFINCVLEDEELKKTYVVYETAYKAAVLY